MSNTSTLHVGHHLTQAVTKPDGSPLPPASIGVVAVPTGIVNFVIDGANNVTLTGVAVGTTTLTYTCTGYASVTDVVSVLAPAPLLVVDGPEV